MRSPRQDVFANVPDVQIQRSVFNRSHGHKTTFDEGYLIPIFCDEVLPGDTFHVKATMFARLSTPLKPIMDNMYLNSFFFFVPLRLVWTNFKKFMGEQANPTDSIVYTVPQMRTDGPPAVNSLWSYFGLPQVTTSPGYGITVNALPFRAYNLIYNEWFKDENLINAATVDMGDSTTDDANYPIRKRAKIRDYFTSCLPYPQKGTAVTLPLASTAPVIAKDENIAMTNVFGSDYHSLIGTYDGVGNKTVNRDTPWASPTGYLRWGGTTGLQADLSTAISPTINALRQAFQLQKFLERDMRGGTRYTEIVRSHFGVISPDARMQRPEYLGGGRTRVNINPVAQTSVAAATPQGNLAGVGTVAAQHGFAKSFTEHGIIIGLVQVNADVTYQQGINKMWSRSTRYDYFWPEFSHLGEQPVTVREIYAKNTAEDAEVFGYQERYAEYRYKPSIVTGKMNSDYSTPLDVWHLGQKFTSKPVLGQTFIEESAPMTRILAVPSEPHFYFDSYFDMKCVRPMPAFSAPGFVDHF